MKNAERAVTRVVERIHAEYHEELTIDDLAETAFYSKFHFTRIFQRITGVTPGCYLSAVRLQKAKELLLTTDLTVTEISHGVGYASGGTFSSRFAHSVGVPPSIYRQLGGFRPADARLARDQVEGPAPRTGSAIHGRAVAHEDVRRAPIFVGIFPGPLHQGRPIRSLTLEGPGPFTLEDVPEGEWYVMACCTAPGTTTASFCHDPVLVGSHGPLEVRAGVPSIVEVDMHRPHMLEPPVLLAPPFPQAA